MNERPQLAAAARPMPGELACGDRAVFWRDPGSVLLAVVDGLGHGPLAAAAAAAAIEHLEARRDAPLAALLASCDQALRGTRGAVMTLVRLHPESGACAHASVGNVEARLLGGGDVPLICTPGVLGARARPARERNFSLRRGATLILHTDGISSRFPVHQLHGRSAAEIVEALMSGYTKAHDDAACAVLVF